MAVYVIGDIQGCLTSLQSLLKTIKFKPQQDQVWFVGDLVNRGPDSLETLRFIHSLGDSARCVLGNHDIHLIACHAGVKKCKADSSLNAVLEDAKADQWIHWLRQQPLLHHDPQLDWLMVHAGLLAEWDLTTAKRCAHELETQLRSDNHVEFITNIYGDEPRQWSEDLADSERWRLSMNAFTRMRMCDPQGALDLSYKGPVEKNGTGLRPWFELKRATEKQRIVFGHWSALGLVKRDNLLAIDTGCLWGNKLTAARIDCDTPIITSIDCPNYYQAV